MITKTDRDINDFKCPNCGQGYVYEQAYDGVNESEIELTCHHCGYFFRVKVSVFLSFRIL